MSFLLPDNLPEDLAGELGHACVTGGPDNMPWPSDVRIESGLLTIERAVDESGYVVAPYDIPEVGARIKLSSSTLMERESPYDLLIELIRGKLNQARCQANDWHSGGLELSPELQTQMRDTSLSFGRALLQPPSRQRTQQTLETLRAVYLTVEHLVESYTKKVFSIRRQRQNRLETLMGCRLRSPVTDKEQSAALGWACNSVCLNFSWNDIEPAEGRFDWKKQDVLLQSVLEQGVAVAAGPLIDFNAACIPEWLTAHEHDPQALARFMTRFVETVVKRYRGKIRRWQLTNSSNCGHVLRLSEDDLLWLSVRLIEVARLVDPDLEIVVGIVQPWGDYMALEDRLHSPFIFADTLVRTGLELSGLNLEMVMGVTPGGTYCRDLLDVSRLLDLYSLLGVPLQVTLGYPSQAGEDGAADFSLRTGAGYWRGGYTPEAQADWAQAVTALAVSKPSVHGVYWVHCFDAEPHVYPHCGLIDVEGKPKPVLQRLHELREQHLR